jgi:hypothetical protein
VDFNYFDFTTPILKIKDVHSDLQLLVLMLTILVFFVY